MLAVQSVPITTNGPSMISAHYKMHPIHNAISLSVTLRSMIFSQYYLGQLFFRLHQQSSLSVDTLGPIIIPVYSSIGMGILCVLDVYIGPNDNENK